MILSKNGRVRPISDPETRKLQNQVRTLLAQNKGNVNNFKYNQSTASSSSLANGSPLVVAVNPIAQSTDESGRVGDLCKYHWVELNWQIYTVSTNPAFNAWVRVMLVLESTALGSALGLSQFFTTATPNAFSARNYLTRNDRRFKVIYDSGPRLVGPEQTPLAVAGYQPNTFGAPNNIGEVVPRIKLNFITDYSRGNAGTVADIDTNALSLICFTDNGTANVIEFAANITLQFTD